MSSKTFEVNKFPDSSKAVPDRHESRIVLAWHRGVTFGSPDTLNYLVSQLWNDARFSEGDIKNEYT